MTPSLSKIPKNAARVDISTAVLTGHMESSSPLLGMDIEHQGKGLSGHYTHDLWLNLSSLPFLDSCESDSPLELTEMLLPSLFHSQESYKSTLLSNSGSLLELFSVSRTCVDSLVPQAPTCDVRFPTSRAGWTESDPCQSPVPEPARRVCHLLSTPFSQEGLVCLDNTTHLARSTAGPPGTHLPETIGSMQHPLWPTGASSPRQTLRARVECCARRQAVLEARVSCVMRRLHAVLGEHALLHCVSQLEGLGRRFDQQGRLHGPPPLSGDPPCNVAAEQEGSGASGGSPGCATLQGIPGSAQLSGEVQSLARCGQAVLRRVQESLDSDATESSSDEEWDVERSSGAGTASGCLSCEWNWQCERAKLASCWTWLQLRLSELDLRIQQIGELHQHILASKASVVLAETQPLTDRQIQQTLLSETAGLTFTAAGVHSRTPEPDTEPSSPTRLLRNIERQSAQLSLMVNSLMAPLSMSPSSSPMSKGTCSHWTGQQKRSFNSPLTDVFLNTPSTLAGQKKRRVCGRRQRPLQVDASCVSARTRPLLTYHKPRLFIMSKSSLRQQELEAPACLCVGCVSCDPVRVCSGTVVPSSIESPYSPAHPVPPLSSEASPSLGVHPTLGREDWLRQSGTVAPHLVFSSPSSRSAEKAPSSLFNCTHRLRTGRYVNHRRLGNPAHWGPGPREPSRPPHTRALKRRPRRQADKDMGLPQPGTVFPASEDSAGEAAPLLGIHTLQRSSQFPVRRRNGKSVYNIDNIVIPMSLAACSKVEKLQYKNILTPSWRLVDIVPLVKKEEEDEEGMDKVEVMSDEVFSHRHQDYERRERLHWSYWGKGRRYTRCTRFSNSTCFEVPDRDRPSDVSDDVPVSNGPSWNFSAPGTPMKLSIQDREAPLPWERRVFPLSGEDEDALRCDEEDKATLWSESRHMESSLPESRGDNSVVFPGFAPTTPSGGCAGKDTHRAQGKLRDPLTCTVLHNN